MSTRSDIYEFSSEEAETLCNAGYNAAMRLAEATNSSKPNPDEILAKKEAVRVANVLLIQHHKQQMTDPAEIALAEWTLTEQLGAPA